MGFAGGALLTPIARLTALRTGIIDRPVGLKIHQRPTPLLGGVAVYFAFALVTWAVLPLTKPVIGVLAGGFAALVVGILDEIFDLPPMVHFAGQVGAGLVAILAGIGVIHTLSVPFAGLTSPALKVPAAVGVVITLLWLVGMMNTMNFLDGLDGLVTGVATLAALLLAIWAIEAHHRFSLPVTPHHEDLLLPLALAGALLGFLPYNWHVARIFLGDSGSMFIGLTIAGLSIIGPAKLGTALLVLLIPVLDVAWAIVRRQLSGRSFLSGDKEHVYHRMLQLGVGYTSTVLVLYALCAVLAAFDLVFVKLAKLVAFVIFTLVIGTAFVLMEIRASRARQGRLAGSASLSDQGEPPLTLSNLGGE